MTGSPEVKGHSPQNQKLALLLCPFIPHSLVFWLHLQSLQQHIPAHPDKTRSSKGGDHLFLVSLFKGENNLCKKNHPAHQKIRFLSFLMPFSKSIMSKINEIPFLVWGLNGGWEVITISFTIFLLIFLFFEANAFFISLL